MVCPNCQRQNAADSQFCTNCGTALRQDCPSCGAHNPVGAQFCHRCGTRTSAPRAEEPPRAPAKEPALFRNVLGGEKRVVALQAERRIITVLFCDVVRSTEMAERMDPEDWTELMNRAFAVLTGPVLRYEGTVARLMGDAVLAFFGAPIAHEDDPHRAVFAALEILAEVKPLAAQLHAQFDLEFQVRIGINTGPVVVGDVGSKRAGEYTAMGDAVNLAARMEQTAAPGTIQIAEETYKLVAPSFELQELGGIEVKGRATSVPAWRVLSPKASPGRLRGLGGVSAPLIGRDREYDQLVDAMNGVQQGRGQIICLIGEAGLGKSRLLDEARKVWLLSNPAYTWEQVQGSPYDTARPYGLFQKFARDIFGIEDDDPQSVIHMKVEKGFEGAPQEVVALCKVTMERVITSRALHEDTYSADARRDDLYDLMPKAWREATLAPTVSVFDDLHWADQASVDLLTHLFPIAEDRPLLFICAFRPERQSPGWKAKVVAEAEHPHRYTEIVLSPLDARRTDDLVSALLNIADLPRGLRDLIIRKTEGNPYFVEEIVRTLTDQGVVYRTDDGMRWKASTAVEDIALPDTLNALLIARIDRLSGEARETLQLASVIGRSFYLRILRAISDSTVALDQHLVALQRVELVREAARLPEVQYIFKHELARDAAYNTILLRKRRELHLLVGEAIEQLFADAHEDQAHRMAQHFALAGAFEKAYRYYLMAAGAAEALSAVAEAVDHLRRALEVADQLPLPPEERNALEKRHQALVRQLVASQPDSSAPIGP